MIGGERREKIYSELEAVCTRRIENRLLISKEVIMRRLAFAIIVVALASISLGVVGEGVVQIEFLHAMSGTKLAVTEDIVNDFNSSHPGIHVQLVYGGSYAETTTKSISRYAAGNPPIIAQVEAAFNRDFIDSGAIVPVYKLFAPYTTVPMDWDSFIEPIRSYYSNDGNVWSLPYNCSTGMLYYNKDMFRAAGLDPNNPPRTFKQLEDDARKVLAAGACEMGITTSWPAWILLENMIPYHGQWFANNENGHKGLPTEVYLTDKFVIDEMSYLAKWAKEGLFTYLGREYSALASFTTGKSLFLFLSTSTLSSVTKKAKFEVGTAFLPRIEGYPLGRSTLGGASLYVFKGFSDAEYEAAATFLKYIASPATTIKWHKGTGYFPLTNGALETLQYQGWFAKDSNYLTALLSLLTSPEIPQSSSPFLGNFVQIRDILDSYIEDVVTLKRTVAK
jgi:sn-glycerol 3-phosphate transport system substrate-binding protein